METSTLVMLAVIAVLAITLASVLFAGTRRNRKAAERREVEQATSAEAHRIELERRAADHANRVAELEAQRVAADDLRDRAVLTSAQGMKWELASRQQLFRACESLGLDAVIATNVVFTPNEGTKHPFCAQVDHLVITTQAVLLVESKRWDGVIFDGVRPSNHAAAFGVLFNEEELVPPFAVQISRPNEGSSSMEWRFDTDRRAPARQARKQARRFSDLLKSRADSVPYIDTCVFYSHGGAKVFTRGFDQEGPARTAIATSSTLARVLKDVHESKSNNIGAPHATLVIDTVRELGADLVGTGRFAAEYQSIVPLTYFIGDDREPATRTQRRTASS